MSAKQTATWKRGVRKWAHPLIDWASDHDQAWSIGWTRKHAARFASFEEAWAGSVDGVWLLWILSEVCRRSDFTSDFAHVYAGIDAFVESYVETVVADGEKRTRALILEASLAALEYEAEEVRRRQPTAPVVPCMAGDTAP